MQNRHQGNKAGDVVDDMFGVRSGTGLADGSVEISRHSQSQKGRKGFRGRYHVFLLGGGGTKRCSVWWISLNHSDWEMGNWISAENLEMEMEIRKFHVGPTGRWLRVLCRFPCPGP